jgi:hypothetical protein
LSRLEPLVVFDAYGFVDNLFDKYLEGVELLVDRRARRVFVFVVRDRLVEPVDSI